MSIQSFISEVKSRGLSRTNRYEVTIPFPNTDATGSRLTTLFCESVNLPGMNIATTSHRMFGEERQMPYERIFDPVTLTFYVDQDLEVKAAFERWIHLVVNQTSRTIAYYNSYIRPITIKVIKEDQQVQSGNGLFTPIETAPYTITLHEAFPKSIQSIQLAADSREIMKVTVQLQYKYWTSSASEKINSSNISAVTQNQDPPQTITGAGYEVPPIIPSILVGRR